MSMVNIHPDIDDPFYRYKMPKLVAKIEGSGNGIKTAVVNMSTIAKALNRSPEYTTKFFGCELGAQVQMYPKDDRWIVNGAHEGMKLQSLLSSFIKKFVLCENCENPETNLVVSRNDIAQKCLACGHTTRVPPGHRLTSYIANHPPTNSKDQNAASGKEDRRLSKKDRKQKQKEKRETPDDVNQSDAIGIADESEVNWSVDVSEEAARLRLEALAKGFDDLSVKQQKPVQTESERADTLFHLVLDNMTSLNEDITQDMIFDRASQLSLENKAPLILSELLFSKDMINEIRGNKRLLQKFCSGNEKAQRYLLGGVEKLVGVLHKDELLPKLSMVLMELYELDIVDETTFRKWAEKPSKKYLKERELVEAVHKHAAPFIKWLDEAEEEEGDEHDEDDKSEEVNVIFSYREEKAVLLDESLNDSGSKKEEDGGIDIDAI